MRMDADGSHRVRLTEAYRRDVDPAWSPTGERIAFASDREGTYDVFVMNPDGTGVVNVTASPASNDREPSWGPDGQWLAFVSDRTGVDEIFVMAQPGDVPQRLLEAFGGASGPVWMPLARAPARLQAPSR